MTLKLPGSRETIDALGSSILEQVQFGLPDDYYETFARKVRVTGCIGGDRCREIDTPP